VNTASPADTTSSGLSPIESGGRVAAPGLAWPAGLLELRQPAHAHQESSDPPSRPGAAGIAGTLTEGSASIRGGFCRYMLPPGAIATL
jgi:hypothetical protein